MPNLAQDINEALLKEFRWHLFKKDQINLESKLKTVRFIGELFLLSFLFDQPLEKTCGVERSFILRLIRTD